MNFQEQLQFKDQAQPETQRGLPIKLVLEISIELRLIVVRKDNLLLRETLKKLMELAQNLNKS